MKYVAANEDVINVLSETSISERIDHYAELVVPAQ
jgi:hypothetical protein